MIARASRYLAVLLVAMGVGCIFAGPAIGSFGVEQFDVAFTNADGSPATQAGSHPFQMATRLDLRMLDSGQGPEPDGGALKDAFVDQIVGLVGNPTALPQCSEEDFTTVPPAAEPATECPDSAAVGVAAYGKANAQGSSIDRNYAPLYNLEPSPGRILRLGFMAYNVPVSIEVGLRSDSPYNPYAVTTNVPQAAAVFGSTLFVWGEPADPAHDPYRGNCVGGTSPLPYPQFISVGNCPMPSGDTSRPPFLTLPRSCQGPLVTSFAVDSWSEPGNFLEEAPDLSDPRWVTGSSVTSNGGEPPVPQGLTGCSQLAFKPGAEVEGTDRSAGSPSGLEFEIDVDDPGLVASGALAQSDIRDVETRFPAGMTINPSVADGLGACSRSEVARETPGSAPGAGCPESSKVGTVEVETPLLDQTLSGSLFVATPLDNLSSNSLIGLYMVIKNADLGIVIRQPIRVEADPTTGQLTAFAEDAPQLPFSSLRLRLRSGQRAPLTTPAGCGRFDVTTVMTPWSGAADITRTATIEVAGGADGAPCPAAGATRFAPSFSAGTEVPLAGTFSPFSLRLDRARGDTPVRQIETTLPKGLLAKLAGVQECSDGQIAAAAARGGLNEGRLEQAAPSCPPASEVGEVLVGAGSGAQTYVKGRAYLAGPYKGAPLSLAVVTPALSGPFDLGTVVIRNALYIDPATAQVRAVSDPIPTILHGVTLDIRSIALDLARPSFTLNPTSCERMSVLGAATSALQQTAALSSPFQVGACAAAQFSPKLSIALKGATKRSGNPALRAVLTQPANQANIDGVSVVLPRSAFIDNEHINNPCTRPQFESGSCPQASILGSAKAFSPLLDEPLEGLVYFRSNGGARELPDLVVALRGRFAIDLVGFIDSVRRPGTEISRVRTRFLNVPDAPVSRFVLSMKGGKRGLIDNSRNLCKGVNRARVHMKAQNGKTHDLNPKVTVACGRSRP